MTNGPPFRHIHQANNQLGISAKEVTISEVKFLKIDTLDAEPVSSNKQS